MYKYNIDKCFGAAARFDAPLNKASALLAQNILKHSERCLQRREDVALKTEKVLTKGGVMDVHLIIPREHTLKSPCLFYIHGGGFMYDAQPHQYNNVAEYAAKTGSVVVFPRYRLTPKASAPILMKDCIAAWNWMIAHANKYGIDPQFVGIGGDSAGGYLTARLTNYVLENHGDVRYQLLVYPVIDCAMQTESMQTESMQKYTDTPMWNAKNNKIMWQWYYNGSKREPSLLDEKLPSPLPPTYVETAEFDCLHDEGLLYADKLKKAGANVTIYETHRTMHGFDIVKCDITKKAVSARIQFIKKQISG